MPLDVVTTQRFARSSFVWQVAESHEAAALMALQVVNFNINSLIN